MRIEPVTFSFKSKYTADNYDSNFLYYRESKRRFSQEKLLHHYSFATAAIAVSAVLIALLRLGKRQKFPDNIVEISDLTKGLNKIKNQEKIIYEIKSKFIYPIKASSMGDIKMADGLDFKNGIVITGNNKNQLEQITDALKEHFEYLDIDTAKVKSQISREKDGKAIIKNLKKNTIAKHVYNEIEKAKEKYKTTGRYTVINMGELDNITNVQITKSKNSKIDEQLLSLTNEKTPGIMWMAWTTETKTIPIYFKDLPILITKL